MTVNPVLFEAIALKKCLEATYNRAVVKLAPYILYRRGEQLFVDAVTVERDGRPPREPRLGTFQLTGLREIALADREFQPEPLFDRDAEKYAGATLFAVE